ncbi:siderophore-iron reductase FhuF [Pseudomonas syringae]|uniref:Iron reductase n=1 Tax=Pseudomonas syringae TaxID=317 RepID=A0A085VA70_PSESX|nr:siderophore-iron reductase FhuF [Pseudomonas syringae]KFE52333.1 iron reductase [Pseudomonas syringae]
MFQPGLAAHAGAAMKFAGALEPFGRTLLAADTAQPLQGMPELLRPEVLDALLLKVYGAQLVASHLPVLVSQWSKYYFMQLIPPVLVGGLLSDWRWPLALEQVSLALDERGLPAGVWLGAGRACHLESPEPFAELLDDNLQPFIAALAAYGGVASSVLWGNAGDYLETCLQQLRPLTDKPLDDGYALLDLKQRLDGRPNPLFKAVSYIGNPPHRQRRSCCLSYQVEWVGRCEHCPLSV